MPPEASSQAPASKEPPHVLKIVAAVALFLSWLPIAALVFLTLVFVFLLSFAAGTLFQLFPITLLFDSPVIVVFLIFWFLALRDYRREKYRDTIILIVIFYALAAVGWYLFITSGAQTEKKQTALQTYENATSTTPASGYLVPTAQSIPAGFQATDKYYSNGSYMETYKAPALYPLGELQFTEINNPAFGAYGTYKALGSPASTTTFGSGSNQLTVTTSHFIYSGSRGFIQVSGVNTGPSYTGSTLINYDLYWDDAGKAVHVSLTDVPEAKFSSQDVINILKTMVHSS